MANQSIGNDPRLKNQTTGTSNGWQQGSENALRNQGKARETRAEPVRPGNPAVTQGGNR